VKFRRGIFCSLPSFGFERVGGDCYRTDLNKPLNKVFFYTNLIWWCDSNRPLQDAKHKIVNAWNWANVKIWKLVGVVFPIGVPKLEFGEEIGGNNLIINNRNTISNSSWLTINKSTLCIVSYCSFIFSIEFFIVTTIKF